MLFRSDPYETLQVPFTCTLGAKTSGTLTSTVRGAGISSTVGIEDFAFSGTSTREVNATASVFDRFSTDAEAPLSGSAGITGGTLFSYTRVVPLKRGCVIYPNTARLVTDDGLGKFSRTTAQICYQANGDVLYIDFNSNSIFIGTYRKSSVTQQSVGGLRVSKIGPSRARAGSTVTYRIRVSNNSFETISGITLTDVLPKGMQFNGVLPQNGDRKSTRLNSSH